jgi:Asp/Glu/hydantoin racemase
MKLILLPPFRNAIMDPVPRLRELVNILTKKGQLEGVEVDVDEGGLLDSTAPDRDEEVMATVTVNVVKKVREYSAMGSYDAICIMGGCEPGLVAGRLVSKIPVTGAIHSSLHVASLIGDRTSIIVYLYDTCLRIRHLAEWHGCNHKLASVRHIGGSSNYWAPVEQAATKQKKERFETPKGKEMIEAIVNQCILAIDKERVDSLILPTPALSSMVDDVRQRLDEKGYDEIPVIGGVQSAVEMAKAMVNMKLAQSTRAYPSLALKVKPEYA